MRLSDPAEIKIAIAEDIFKPDTNIYKLRDTLRDIYAILKSHEERIKKLETNILTIVK